MNSLLKVLPVYWKAVIGFLAPAAGVLLYANQQGGIDQAAWVAALCTAVVTAGGVGYAQNEEKKKG